MQFVKNEQSGIFRAATRTGKDIEPRPSMSRQEAVPPVIRGINFTGLVILGVMLVPAAAVRLSQAIVILAAVALLIGLYWKFQHKPAVSALHLSLSLSVILWVIMCENVISVDNVLGSHVTAQLDLGLRLKAFAKDNLKHQDKFREMCCGDPLTWHYRPGSTYRAVFDCANCNRPLELLVDPTGYLNRQYDFLEDGKPVDVFIAGDSVLEGVGTPGIVEFLNELMPKKFWSLSANNYGPRQKVNALIAYGLSQHPRSLILEFYGGNDATDAIITESCAATGTFYCLFTVPERHRALLRYEPFASMINHKKNRPGLFDDIVGDSLTLAVTRFVVSHAKGMMKEMLATPHAASVHGGDQLVGFLPNDPPVNAETRSNGKQQQFKRTEVAFPGAAPEYAVLPERWLEWVKEGMAVAFKEYDRLSNELSHMDHRPTVILLYNPSAYEIYRDILVEPDSDTDQISAYQRRAIRNYADNNGWQVIDLTDVLGEEVVKRGLWLFGQHDRVHWSTDGTKIVASVLARELAHMTQACTSEGDTMSSVC